MPANARDTIMLQLDDQQVHDFVSYRVSSNLFEAADGFELELASTSVRVQPGQQCKLYVNDVLELVGIVDRIAEERKKSTATLKLAGRDLMGLLVDSYAEDFKDIPNESLSALTQRLLAKIPFINRKRIIFGAGSKDRAVPLTAKDEEYDFTEVQPARTVFEIMKRHALSRGQLFFCMPDGTFVFGQPRTSGAARYVLISRLDGADNNVIEADRTRDISKRYSKIIAIAERQGTDAWEPEELYQVADIEDKTFPFYKPFVVTVDNDGQHPERYARVLMDKQRFEGFQLSYKTGGHSQAGRNWQVNEICRVIDDPWQIDADHLIYGRTFELSKSDGATTTLLLSHLGVLPA
jgi:prophage tail gpP-like protein